MKQLSENAYNAIIWLIVGASALGVLVGAYFLIAALKLQTSSWSGKAELNRADWNRQIIVREAQAKLDSATLIAKAEIERAKGVAEANKIIGDSLHGNEAYLKYLWIDSLQHTQDKIIYVPTEAGLPLLEANRLR